MKWSYPLLGFAVPVCRKGNSYSIPGISTREIKPFLICLAALLLTPNAASSQDSAGTSIRPHSIEVAFNDHRTDNLNYDLEALRADGRVGPLVSGEINALTTDLDYKTRSSHGGLSINFLFSGLDIKGLAGETLLLLGFGSGTYTTRLLRVNSDSVALEYEHEGSAFRISQGVRHNYSLSKRFELYQGIEVIHQFQISSTLLEKRLDMATDEVQSERRLFAKKGYSPFLYLPIGLKYQLGKLESSRRTAIFYHFQLAVGSQYAPGKRFNGVFTGSRIGLLFRL